MDFLARHDMAGCVCFHLIVEPNGPELVVSRYDVSPFVVTTRGQYDFKALATICPRNDLLPLAPVEPIYRFWITLHPLENVEPWDRNSGD